MSDEEISAVFLTSDMEEEDPSEEEVLQSAGSRGAGKEGSIARNLTRKRNVTNHYVVESSTAMEDEMKKKKMKKKGGECCLYTS